MAMVAMVAVSSVAYAQTDTITITATVGVQDATNFAVSSGQASCGTSWNTSLTPNVDNQELTTYFWDGAVGTPIQTDNLVFPGSGAADATTVYGLTPGQIYYFGHISQVTTAGLSSTGITSAFCIPTNNPANPAPILDPEPATTLGTSNTLSFHNGGGTLLGAEFRIVASTENLGTNPYATPVYESDWHDNMWAGWSFDGTNFTYTFSPLTTGTTYFYHVQKRIKTYPLFPSLTPMVWEYSAFSNVEFSTQTTSSGGGGGGGGGTPPPPPPVCGNGSNEAGEQCDDGNTISGDGCSASCILEVLTPICGNSAVEGSETCDDGNTISGDGCSSTCALEIPVGCGNGTLNTGEECDDGNNTSGDGCSNVCTIEIPEEPQVCGNGLVETGEECDDGNVTSGDGCSAICEDELIEVTFHIKAKPEYRMIIDATPNLDMSSILGLEDNFTGNMTIHNTVAIDDFGLATYKTEIPVGNYDAGINGEAHLTKIIRNINITETTSDVNLDFTFGNTVELLAGDIKDDNFVNALDIAIMLQSYQHLGNNIADLNNEDYINALDMAVLLKNYFKLGENY